MGRVSGQEAVARQERRKLVTRVIFLLSITKVGAHACDDAINLVVVDIPEGVERFCGCAFGSPLGLLPMLQASPFAH